MLKANKGGCVMENTDTIDDIRQKIDNLPFTDSIAFEVIFELGHPKANHEKIIKRLPAATAERIVAFANSAHFAENIGAVEQVIDHIDADALKQILTASVLIDHFVRNRELRDFNFEKFERQARFYCAIIKALGEIIDYPEPGDLLAVAFLHNIGKPTIAAYFKDEYKEIMELKTIQAAPITDAEKTILGGTHGEIGALVLERFNMPGKICKAVNLHDTKQLSVGPDPDNELVLITRAAGKLIHNFFLPAESALPDVKNCLKQTTESSKQVVREETGGKPIRLVEDKKAYVSLLKETAAVVYKDLKSALSEKRL